MSENEKILWLDLETSGLDLDNDHILEIGMIVTDGLHEEIDAFSRIVMPTDFNPMRLSSEVFVMHATSGLLMEMRMESSTAHDAVHEAQMWLNDHFPVDEGTIRVGGSGIDRFDIPLMRGRSPWNLLANRFHWRTLDVSGLKQVAQLADFALPGPATGHRALDDARWAFQVARRTAAGLSNLNYLHEVSF